MLDKYYREHKIKTIDKSITFILLAMIAIIPIITSRYTTIAYSPIYLNNVYGTGYTSDIFNLYKTIALYIGTGAILVLFIQKTLKHKQEIKNSKLNILCIIMIIGILGSVILSKYKDIAIFGNLDRREGALAWICYITIFFIIYNTNIEKKYYKYFYFALFPFLIINTFTSISTTVYNVDLVSNGFIQFLIGGEGRLQGKMYTTLYHYNFGSGIASLMFGVSFMYMLLEKDIKKKIILLVGTVLSFTTTIALISNGGFVTMIVLTPIIIVIAYRFTNKKDIAIWSTLTFIINALIFIFLNNQNDIVYKESFALLEKINKVSGLIIPAILALFIIILITMKFTNEKKFFKYTSIVAISTISICILVYGYTLNKQDKIIDNNPNAKIERIQDKEIFKKLNEISTDRLNIWTKTINLINDKPIFGYGFDTFPYEFIPNDENGGESTYGEVIDKPHNWYLTIAYGSGIVGLVAVLGVLIYSIKNAFYNYADKVDNKYIYIFAIGVIAYAIQGFFNDSLVGTSIFLWIFAGLLVNIVNPKNELIE